MLPVFMRLSWIVEISASKISRYYMLPYGLGLSDQIVPECVLADKQIEARIGLTGRHRLCKIIGFMHLQERFQLGCRARPCSRSEWLVKRSRPPLPA